MYSCAVDINWNTIRCSICSQPSVVPCTLSILGNSSTAIASTVDEGHYDVFSADGNVAHVA